MHIIGRRATVSLKRVKSHTIRLVQRTKNISTPAEITGLTASALKTSIELFDKLQPLRFRVSREGQCDRRFRQL